MATEQQPTSGNDRRSLDQKALQVILIAVGIGSLATLVFCFQAASFTSGASTFAFGIATTSASLLVGGLIGFLFGIPRRLQQEQTDSGKARAKPEKEDEDDTNNRSLYSANTNLEQISDWLTKILVGVGLTQIGKIGTSLETIGTIAAEGMPGFVAAKAFFIAIIIHFTVSGFLLGYLWTRLYLGRALTEADRASSLKKKLDKYEQDARALRIAAQQLSGDDTERSTRADLNAVIKAASPEARSHIFYRAQHQRWRNWRLNKPIMERTIPIFEALVASDTQQNYHANYGQLGFALKDQQKPDWQAAEQALSHAIEIRGDVTQTATHSYEFNRAICRIMQDQAFDKRAQAQKAVQLAIVGDLKVAVEDEWVLEWVKNDNTITEWLKINKIDLDDLDTAQD